jgi:hypothetical protein
MVTPVPPTVGPEFGLTLVTVGAADEITANVNWSADGLAAEVPPGVVTVTSTVPADSVGLVAVTDVGLLTVTPVAAVVPKSTAVAPVRFVPVMVTLVPPAVGPEVGLTPVTVGTVAGAANVNLSAVLVAETSVSVLTVTSTVPADPAGLVAAIDVALFTVKLVAGTVPKFTPVAAVKPVPVMVTLVPPVVGPEAGLTPVTVGAATKKGCENAFGAVKLLSFSPTYRTQACVELQAGSPPWLSNNKELGVAKIV